MTSGRLRWPDSVSGSLLAALTTWVALWAWSGFVARPSGFLWPALGACLLVAVSGMLLRAARVPSLLVVLGQLSLLFGWLNRTWAAEEMLLGWVPTAESVARVGARVEVGAQVAQSYAAPVPDSAPQIYALLVVAGAGTAVLVDFLACGLRRVPLAGLPLLAVYTAPLSILDGGVSWWVFTAGALSFLSLLASDEARRLSSWGRSLSGSGQRSEGQVFESLSTGVNTAAVRASARKIGFTATGLAVVLPVFIPTLGTDLFGPAGSGGNGEGDTVAISNPMVDLKRDLTRGRDVELLRVRTSEPDPSYMRVSVLDAFDGKTWEPSGRDIPIDQRADGRMPNPPGLAPSVPRSKVPYEVEVSSAFESYWLPTPYPVSRIDAEGDWRYDTNTLDVISATDGQTTEGMSYTLEAMNLDLDAEALVTAPATSEELFTPNTELPDSVPDSVRDLTRDLTNRETSRFEKAVRLQRWFREDGGFTYSLDRSSGNGVDDLTEFLGDGPSSRVGYCEQFAAAMAVMGRSIGIPSRVAVGFLRPERIADDTYVYGSHDLHAWPEMYFEGTGWVRFEPTPQDRASDVPAYTSSALPEDEPNETDPTGAPSELQNRIDEERLRAPAPTVGGGGSDGGDAGMLPVLLSGLLLAVLIASPRLVRTWLRRRRWSIARTPSAVAEAAWSELRDSAIDLGLPWDDAVTVRVRARALVRSFGEPDTDAGKPLTRYPRTGPAASPEATAALERLVGFVERARYARSVNEAPEGVQHDVSLVVSALRAGRGTKRRLRAKWLPASLAGTFSAEAARRSRSRIEGGGLPTPGVDHAV